MSSWNACLQTIVSIFKISNKLLGLVQNRHDLRSIITLMALSAMNNLLNIEEENKVINN
jgi:hypothetical protein